MCDRTAAVAAVTALQRQEQQQPQQPTRTDTGSCVCERLRHHRGRSAHSHDPFDDGCAADSAR